jgi:uncharacterized protein
MAKKENFLNSPAIRVFMYILLVGVIFAVFAYGYHQYKIAETSLYPVRTMRLSATGNVSASPDIVYFSVGVVSEGEKVADISNENNAKMNSIISFLKTKGVSEKDIKTTDYSISPKYEEVRDEGDIVRRDIVGYVLNQSIKITLRDFNLIDEIFGELSVLGANKVSSLSFDIEDKEGLKNEARILAIAQIERERSQIESNTGVDFGKIISIDENNYGPYNEVKGMGVSMDREYATPASIQSGSYDLSQTINITYELK